MKIILTSIKTNILPEKNWNLCHSEIGSCNRSDFYSIPFVASSAARNIKH